MNEAVPIIALGLLVGTRGLAALLDSPIYGDIRARLAAALFTDDERRTAERERYGREPGDDGEVRT